MPGAEQQQEVLDVREAAALVNRHPETIRRWIWSGKLAATRSGTRLLVTRDELWAASGGTEHRPTLAEWAERAREARRSPVEGTVPSGVDLIREGREERTRRLLELAGR